MSKEEMHMALDALIAVFRSHQTFASMVDPYKPSIAQVDAWHTARRKAENAIAFFQATLAEQPVAPDGDIAKLASKLAALRAALAEQTSCWCHKCNEGRTVNGIPFSMTRMIVCPDCGDKRCPKASNHEFACTVSNAPGQPGSVYGKAEQPAPVCFQDRVQPWMLACFGPEISADKIERNHRFLEEALELVQACGCTAAEAHQLVDYVYGRPTGEPGQEVGGVMVTLAALCLAQGLDMNESAETELARIWTKVEQIRAKQAAKPKNSPLPAEQPAAMTESKETRNARVQDRYDELMREGKHGHYETLFRIVREELVRATLIEQPADWHHLTQYGYAPGHYMNQCRQCSLVKDGLDKRCYICRECAEIRHIQATTKILPLAEQPAAPVGFARICDSLPEGVNWGDPLTPAMARHIFESSIPPGYCVVKDEPVARMLTWRGPSHTPTPPRAARTYAEFPEDAALPANKEAYWENAEPLYAAKPGGSNEQS